MEFRYRGIAYTVTQAITPDLWRWQVKIGNPAMLRLGEAKSEMQAELQVKIIIDRSIERKLSNDK